MRTARQSVPSSPTPLHPFLKIHWPFVSSQQKESSSDIPHASRSARSFLDQSTALVESFPSAVLDMSLQSSVFCSLKGASAEWATRLSSTLFRPARWKTCSQALGGNAVVKQRRLVSSLDGEDMVRANGICWDGLHERHFT